MANLRTANRRGRARAVFLSHLERVTALDAGISREAETDIARRLARLSRRWGRTRPVWRKSPC